MAVRGGGYDAFASGQVIHTSCDATAEQWYREDCEDIFELSLPGSFKRYFTKIRPGVHEFLARIASKFEMHVYTMGTRQYAKEIVK